MICAEATTVAVIPARAGSKGIPHKNLVNVAGRPLIEWTLLAVSSARLEMRAVVSTDSQDIADFCSGFGTEVVWRPTYLAGDASPTEPGVVHALNAVGAADGDVLMILQATSPIRLSGTIDRMHASFLSRQVDTMVAVVKESPFIWRGPVSSPTPKFNVNSRPRRQEFRPEDVTYRETGSIYLSRVGPFIEKGNRIHGSCALHVLDAIEGADVDTVHDLAVVAALIETLDGAA